EENSDFDVPVIFLTAKTDPGSELEGLSLGAVDYIFKPFSPMLLIKRIENSILMFEQRKQLKRFNENLQGMVLRQSTQISELQSAVFDVVSNLVEFRDDVTGNHITQTSRFLGVLLDAMFEQGVYAAETRNWDREVLLTSVKLHDVGKIGISDVILNKREELTPEEFEEIKRHVELGDEIIERIRNMRKDVLDDTFLFYAANFVSYHHEKWDGSGYPHGLAGMDIPLLGRLMAVVDVYDALISNRPYKEAYSLDVAQRIMQEGRGTYFDPQILDVFLNVRVKNKIDLVANELRQSAMNKIEN
ncbi:MAG: HD domain-containing protein, partial [Clostridiales Family XIII bacterium]|nr:HD domain-containing protein [Clostridiales Family XIII bacterium]